MLTETKETQTESKADFWQRHIENCSRSALSQAQYCKDHSLVLATFCYWKRRLNMTEQEKVRFYPLTVQPVQNNNAVSSPAGLSLHLGKNKYRIDLAEEFSAPALKKLLTTLEQL